MLGPTVYTFSIILAVFLTGLGIGSTFGIVSGPRGCTATGLRWAFARCCWPQQLPGPHSMLAHTVPYWPIDPLHVFEPVVQFSARPVALRVGDFCRDMSVGELSARAGICRLASAGRGTDGGWHLCGEYGRGRSWRGHLQSVSHPPLWDSAGTALLIVISALASLLMLVPQFWPSRAETASGFAARPFRTRIAALGWLTALIGLAVLLAWSASAVPGELVANGRSMLTSDQLADVIYVGEGMNTSVAVSETGLGDRYFHMSGKVEASTVPADMRLQRMLGHLPAFCIPSLVPCSWWDAERASLPAHLSCIPTLRESSSAK